MGVYAVVNLAGIGLDLATGGTPTSCAAGTGLRLAAGHHADRGATAVHGGGSGLPVPGPDGGPLAQAPRGPSCCPSRCSWPGTCTTCGVLALVAIMAVSMGNRLVTWRTGGLEADIALHAVNNMTVSLFAMLGFVDMNDTSGSADGPGHRGDPQRRLHRPAVRLVKRHPEVAVTRTWWCPRSPRPPRLPTVRPAAIAADRSGLAATPRPRHADLPEPAPAARPLRGAGRPGRYVGVLHTRAGDMQPTTPGPMTDSTDMHASRPAHAAPDSPAHAEFARDLGGCDGVPSSHRRRGHCGRGTMMPGSPPWTRPSRGRSARLLVHGARCA
ncbi:lysostaphin resistance A-like protein [Kocuria rhizophila]|nr:lysostaphin resistance A-like protein [Kocuria rhizophila]